MNRHTRILLFFALAGCAPEAGTAKIELSFPGSIPEEQLELHLRVEQRADATMRGPILASSDAVMIAGGANEARIPRLAVPHGDARVAVVEIFAAGEERPRYYGLSAPFSLRAGQNITVLVPLGFLEPPQGRVSVASDFVKSTDVQLSFDMDTAVRVHVSNKIGFPPDLATDSFELAELTRSGDVFVHDWDLDDGLEPKCFDNDRCLREVFVRFEDAAGYESRTSTVTVHVDMRAPRLREGALPVSTYVPDWDPHRAVSAIGPHTHARVAFELSEEVQPVVVLVSNGLTGSCEGTTLVYCTIDSSDESGTYAIEAHVTDLAGNPGSIALGTFVVDGVAPAAPQAPILYQRTPWGDAKFSVVGSAGALEAGATPIVLDRPALDMSGGLGIVGSSAVPAAANGSFEEVVLSRADRARVWIVAVDAAGNASDVALVADEEWTATAGDASPQSQLNPHVVELVPQLDEFVLYQDPREVELATTVAARAIGAADGSSLEVLGTAGWVQRNPPTETPARKSHVMAFDRERGRLVIFGGSALEILQDTMEWDGERWLRPILRTAEPPGRIDGVMVFDAAHGRTILFGGSDEGSIPLSDTWAYDGAHWEQICEVCGPSPRVAPMATYDSKRGVVILTGGYSVDDIDHPFTDTWELDGNIWREVQIPGPIGVRNGAMAFDARRGVAVLFGGITTAGTEPWGEDETWEYEGTQWTQVTSAGAPPQRGYHAMAYDEARERMVMFGGSRGDAFTDPANVLGDAWEYLEVGGVMTWRALDGSTLRGARTDLAMAYVPQLEDVVVFGGHSRPDDFFVRAQLGDLWGVSDGLDRAPGSTPPNPRDDAAMAFDRASGKTFLFGGTVGGDFWYADTWTWDGMRWDHLADVVGTSAVPEIAYPRMVDVDGVLHLFGLDFYTFDPVLFRWTGSDWQQLIPASTPLPSIEFGQVPAFDPATRELMIFGGSGVDDEGNQTFLDTQYAWAGSDWHPVTPSNAPPPGRWAHAMASDIGRGKVILFGGQDYAVGAFDDLWEWDGSASTWNGPFTGGPAARLNPAMAYDSGSSRVIVSGGLGDTLYGDFWEWDGTQWTTIATSGVAPRARAGHNLVYDPARNRLITFGGCPTFVPCSAPFQDLWELDRGGTDRPALHVGFAVRTASVARDRVERIRVTSAAAPAFEAFGWDAFSGSWISLAAPVYETPSADVARRLIAADGFVHVVLVPTSGARIAVDQIELSVAFRAQEGE